MSTRTTEQERMRMAMKVAFLKLFELGGRFKELQEEIDDAVTDIGHALDLPFDAAEAADDAGREQRTSSLLDLIDEEPRPEGVSPEKHIRNLEAKDRSFRVLDYMARISERDGACRESEEEMARATGMSVERLQSAVRDLLDGGLIAGVMAVAA